MKKVYIKYALILSTTLFLFGNFISCGAKYYQMSLRDDVSTNPQNDSAMGATEGSNDPESLSFGIHALNGWKKLPIAFKVDKGLTDQQLTGLTTAMRTWEKLVGRKLFDYQGRDQISGDSFSDLFSSLNDHVNGDYLDYNWEKTNKPRAVLATTIWNYTTENQGMIDTADIRFNMEYYVIGDAFKLKPEGDREVVDMQSLALHELGHLLGLTHIEDKNDPGSIMTPKLMIGEGLSKRKVSKGDIERVQRIYGCEGNACDVEQLLSQIEYNLNNEANQLPNEQTAPSPSDAKESDKTLSH